MVTYYTVSSYVNAMLIMARDRSYLELQEILKDRKVLIWTCNTCARMCYGLGGKDSAERLANRLSEDGVDVRGVLSVSAACIESKVLLRREEVENKNADIILALMCSIGTRCAERIFGMPVVNPVKTYGLGYLSAAGDPVIVSEEGERILSEVSDNSGPFV